MNQAELDETTLLCHTEVDNVALYAPRDDPGFISHSSHLLLQRQQTLASENYVRPVNIEVRHGWCYWPSSLTFSTFMLLFS